MRKFTRDFIKMLPELQAQLEQGLVSEAEFFAKIYAEANSCLHKTYNSLQHDIYHAQANMELIEKFLSTKDVQSVK